MSSVMDKALAMTERMVKARDEARAERDAARADLAEALEALRAVMVWIDAWDPPFTQDEAWPDDDKLVNAVLSKHQQPKGGAT